MKIEDLIAQQKIFSPEKIKSSQVETEKFADYLKEVEGKINNTTSTQASSELPPLSPVALIPQATSPEAGIKTVEEGLSCLERYQQALGSKDVSLKEMAPLVTAMEQGSQRLQDLAKQLPADSPLKSVAEETASLSKVESMKFWRGDYV
jgi:hypothetical protein